MNNSQVLAEESAKIDYNQIPVYYCKNCLDLKARYVVGMEDSEYCDSCGSTNIGCCSIFEYLEMYKERFGHYPLEQY